MKGVVQNIRKGIVLKISAVNGIHSYGDAAPFPSLHKEVLSDLFQLMPKISSDISGRKVPESLKDIIHLAQLFNDLPASMQFAIGSALIGLTSKIQKKTFAEFVKPAFQNTIQINGLLSGESKALEKNLHKFNLQNYRTLKLKVATGNLIEESTLVHKTHDFFEGQIKLRLDANRNWTYADALRFANLIKDIDIEYIEEPFDSPTKFCQFFQETGLNIALDETLSEYDLNEIQLEGISALILKPSVIGSYEKMMNQIEFAQSHKLKLVFSSAFESGIGLRTIASLASAFGSPDCAHGLDTYRWLEKDLTIPAFTSDGPQLIIDKRWDDFELDMNRYTIVL